MRKKKLYEGGNPAISSSESQSTDSNWMFDSNGNPVPFEIQSLLRYFERAVFSFNAAEHIECPPKNRSMLTAFCLHACQSFSEALERVNQVNTESAAVKNSIRFSALVEEMRNHDIHGFPLPVCDPNFNSMLWVANPNKPMTLTSSHGVAVQVQMHGATPKVRRSPKDQKHGKFSPGQSISYLCFEGELIVHDFSSNKDYRVMGVLRQFLEDAQNALHAVTKSKGLEFKPD